jgi:hypothetical protein
MAVIFLGLAVGSSAADLENQVFTSKQEAIRLVIPRGWRATDQASYPGLLLWLMRNQPDGRIALTAEPFTRNLFCSWPVQCQASRETNAAKYACALRTQLVRQHFHVGPTQIGPKENETAGLPSVWFEYDDGSHFLRQAIAMDQRHAVSLVLSAPSADARANQIRAFEQTLRTLRPLTPEELGVAGSAAAIGSASAGSGIGSDGNGSAGGTSSAGSDNAGSAGLSINPVGACA